MTTELTQRQPAARPIPNYISTRLKRILSRMQIESVEQLAQLTHDNFKYARGVGKETWCEATKLLLDHGLRFKEDVYVTIYQHPLIWLISMEIAREKRDWEGWKNAKKQLYKVGIKVTYTSSFLGETGDNRTI